MLSRRTRLGKLLPNHAGLGDTIAALTHSRIGNKLAAAVPLPQSIRRRLPADLTVARFAEWYAHRKGWPDCGCEQRQRRLNSLFPYDRTTLTIGLPHRNDFEGVWATARHLAEEIRREGLGNVVELLIVDQSNPSSELAGHTNALAGNLTTGGVRCRYHNEAKQGSAPAKQAAFSHSETEWTMVLDCHVHLAAGSLAAVYRHCNSRRWRHSRDLFYGVLLHDHADPSAAEPPALTDLKLWKDDPEQPRETWPAPVRGWIAKAPQIGSDLVWGKWHSDPELCSPTNPPKEIEASGGWALLARRDSFVGYHPAMEGFGGEEGYTAEATRNAGARVYSLPPFRGFHRFRRTHSVHYGPDAATIKNHVVGTQSLAGNLDQLRDALAAENDPAFVAESLSIALDQLNASNELSPDQQREREYRRVCEARSDINEHLPLIRKLAADCSHVTEFGTGPGHTLRALLHAQPAELHTYDTKTSCSCGHLNAMAGETQLEYHHGPEFDSAAMPTIAETDLLIVDTTHTREHVAAELQTHGNQSRRWIVLHDTTTYGTHGEGHSAENPVAGIRPAIADFLENNPHWSIVTDLANNNGLTVLARAASCGKNCDPQSCDRETCKRRQESPLPAGERVRERGNRETCPRCRGILWIDPYGAEPFASVEDFETSPHLSPCPECNPNALPPDPETYRDLPDLETPATAPERARDVPQPDPAVA